MRHLRLFFNTLEYHLRLSKNLQAIFPDALVTSATRLRFLRPNRSRRCNQCIKVHVLKMQNSIWRWLDQLNDAKHGNITDLKHRSVLSILSAVNVCDILVQDQHVTDAVLWQRTLLNNVSYWILIAWRCSLLWSRRTFVIVSSFVPAAKQQVASS